jgi:nicotinamidase-related amidase
MQQIFNLDIPQTLEEACDPTRTALLVYDMQLGIFEQAPALKSVTPQVVAVLAAARKAKVRTFFSRHLSLPNELTGISQLRTAMAWQKLSDVKDIKPAFLRDNPNSQLIPEMQPQSNEIILDKLGMSFFEGTPLDMVLRDCHVTTFIIVGVVLEIGIVPTILNGTDLGYIPIVITDGCGSVNDDARKRALDDLRYSGNSFMTDAATICELL